MDLREIGVEKLFGMVLGFFAPMNGGKTQAVVSELERVIHSGYNVIGYNSTLNVRDKESLTIDERISFAGKSVPDILELRKDFARRSEIIMSREYRYRGKDGLVAVDGIEHKKYVPLKGIGIDEINLFCLTEKDIENTLEFLNWTKHNNIVVYLSGLVFDFRHMPFGNVLSLFPYIDIKEEKKPVCKAVCQGKQCGAPAMHTQRLWSIDFAKELGLGELVQQMEIFDFAQKEGIIVNGTYVPAPFFDKTLRIEEVKDKKVVYLPVCDNCSRLPYQKEVFQVYNAIISGSNSEIQGRLLEEITNFLNNEKWVNGNVPIAYYKNIVGGYSPRR